MCSRAGGVRWWQPQLAGRSAAERAGRWARLQVDAACRLDLALIPAAVAARARIGMLRTPFNHSGSNKLWCPVRQHSTGGGTYAAGSASKREQAGPPWNRRSPGHLDQRYGAVWDVYRLWRDVDVVKQVLPHEAVVGLQGRRQEADDTCSDCLLVCRMHGGVGDCWSDQQPACTCRWVAQLQRIRRRQMTSCGG